MSSNLTENLSFGKIKTVRALSLTIPSKFIGAAFGFWSAVSGWIDSPLWIAFPVEARSTRKVNSPVLLREGKVRRVKK